MYQGIVDICHALCARNLAIVVTRPGFTVEPTSSTATKSPASAQALPPKPTAITPAATTPNCLNNAPADNAPAYHDAPKSFLPLQQLERTSTKPGPRPGQSFAYRKSWVVPLSSTTSDPASYFDYHVIDKVPSRANGAVRV